MRRPASKAGSWTLHRHAWHELQLWPDRCGERRSVCSKTYALRNAQGTVVINAKVANGAVHLYGPQQQLHRPQVAGLLYNLRHLGPAHRVCAIRTGFETDHLWIADPSFKRQQRGLRLPNRRPRQRRSARRSRTPLPSRRRIRLRRVAPSTYPTSAAIASRPRPLPWRSVWACSTRRS